MPTPHETSTASLANSSNGTGSPPPVRYIKLGPGGAWAKRSLEHGEIHFGHREVAHEVAATRDKAAIMSLLTASERRSPVKAADFAREVLDFYTLGPDAIWITFEGGYLWWARAEPEVIPTERSDTTGSRFRRTIGPWRKTDELGRDLRENALSTRLTKVGAYRQTLCRVEAEGYLLRKIAGEEEPIVAKALAVRADLVASAADLIAALHWRDFETLVDLILARGGWHRVSTLGGTMKDADLIVEQAVTGETALVQVKSAASQAVLDEYVAIFDGNGTWSRLIFVCHSPRGALEAPPDRPEVIVWTRHGLAETAIGNGLFDWLIGRAG